MGLCSSPIISLHTILHSLFVNGVSTSAFHPGPFSIHQQRASSKPTCLESFGIARQNLDSQLKDATCILADALLMFAEILELVY
jgi:hypothetical protein